MSTITNNVSNAASTASAASATTSSNANTSTSVTDASDRFLKLLVTQMQNQDPLNPMDNAQVTSQMAQINTVTGIEKLNTTMGNMSTNFTQMQMLQGVSLVGHGVLLEGSKLAADSDGNAVGAYELSGAASKVSIEIKSAAGKVIDTIQKDTQASGQHDFTWTPPEGTDLKGMTFNVKATSGSTAIGSTNLMTDMVDAVRTDATGLTVHLRNNGETAYSKVKALS
jgi:flagellar basal-body rod modification protein FlgD